MAKRTKKAEQAEEKATESKAEKKVRTMKALVNVPGSMPANGQRASRGSEFEPREGVTIPKHYAE